MTDVGERIKVLFVDDDPLLLQGMQRMLRPLRDTWRVNFAVSAADALRALEGDTFDVVVTDLHMPGQAGDQLLRLVRIRQPQCVRILLSGQSDRTVVMNSVGAAHQYLAKPARAETVRDTIARLVRLRSMLGNSSLRRLLTSLETLSSLPQTSKELADELESDFASVATIGDLVARDVGMCAKVLQIVNSSFFGLSKKVTRAQEAVSYLGLDFVKSLMLSEHLFTQCTSRGSSLDLINRIRTRSLRVSALAGRMARNLGQPRQVVDNSVAAGMLAQVGLLALHGLLPPAYSQVERLATTVSWLEAERKVLGTTHPEVGAYLMGLWGLPPEVVDAIAWHLEPHKSSEEARTGFSPLAAVHIASALDRPEGEMDLAYVDSLGLRDKVETWRAWDRTAT